MRPSWKTALFVCALAFAARLTWELGGVVLDRLHDEWKPMGSEPVLSSAIVFAAFVLALNVCARQITRRAFSASGSSLPPRPVPPQ